MRTHPDIGLLIKSVVRCQQTCCGLRAFARVMLICCKLTLIISQKCTSLQELFAGNNQVSNTREIFYLKVTAISTVKENDCKKSVI